MVSQPVPTQAPSGASIVFFDQLDSTSLEAKRRAEAGARGPLWIIAGEQTAGYGRRGTGWTHGSGDLAATLLFEESADAKRRSLLTYVAALAVAEGLETFPLSESIQFKWPNDIFLGGAKTGGLLMEAVGEADLFCFGVGINIVNRPTIEKYATASLTDFFKASGAEGLAVPTPTELLVSIDQKLAFWRGHFRQNGFEPVREAWMNRAIGLGKPASFATGNETIAGTFDGIGEDGSALMTTPNGQLRFFAGRLTIKRK
ncbi:MAG: biotin--[acetyl-CoA-carboxylase] ligase [Pseudomonadota bacterium]